jgi:cell division protein FtsL
LSSWFAEAAVAEPVTRPRAKPKSKAKPKPRAKAKARQRARARSGVLWIAISGVLLAGVVFVNVAVLRLNLELDKATQTRAQLQASDAALESQLSSELASPRIQKQAQQDGLVQVDPSTIGYINLGK